MRRCPLDRLLARIIDALDVEKIVAQAIAKCGGEGGKPGPCPENKPEPRQSPPSSSSSSPGGSSGGTPPTARPRTPEVQRRIEALKLNLSQDNHGKAQVRRLVREQEAQAATTANIARKQKYAATQSEAAFDHAFAGRDAKSRKCAENARRARAKVKKLQDIQRERYLAHIAVTSPAQVDISGQTSPQVMPDVQEAKKIMEKLLGDAAVHKIDLEAVVNPGSDRAEWRAGTIHLPPDYSMKNIMHEIGHEIADTRPRIKELCQDFLDMRCDPSEQFEPLSKCSSKYRSDEYGRKDDFGKLFPGDESAAYYVGKHYPDGDTEVLTMGLELLYEDAAKFAKADPEYFSFVTGILAGRI